MKRLTHCIIALCLCFAALCALPTVAYAKNEDYVFDLVGDGTRNYHVYTKSSNNKTIPGDPATVMVDRSTQFPSHGYTWSFRMYYKGAYNSQSDATDKTYTQATHPIFTRGYDTFHPTYLPRENVTGRNYYIGARLDDRVDDPNSYHAAGKFNADFTNP